MSWTAALTRAGLALSGGLLAALLASFALAQVLPAGGIILFNSERDGHAGVYMLDPAFRLVYPVGVLPLAYDEQMIDTAWSWDGSLLAMLIRLAGRESQIYLIGVADGHWQTLWPRPIPYRISGMDWSPDGQWLAVAWQDEIGSLPQIYRISTESGLYEPLIENEQANARPVWSPDGSRIAFQSQVDGRWQLFVLELESGAITRLTDETTSDARHAWSPDGQRIAFVALDGSNRDLYLMNADGSGRQRLTDHPAVDSSPAWAPDGRRIAFVSNRAAPGMWDIYLLELDSGRVTRLTDHPSVDLNPMWRR